MNMEVRKITRLMDHFVKKKIEILSFLISNLTVNDTVTM